jgi:hypothetical protein
MGIERIICFRVPRKTTTTDLDALGVMVHAMAENGEEITHRVELFLLDGDVYRPCFEAELKTANVRVAKGMMELRSGVYFLNYSFGNATRNDLDAEQLKASFSTGSLRATEVYLFETNFFEHAQSVSGFIGAEQVNQKQDVCASLF